MTRASLAAAAAALALLAAALPASSASNAHDARVASTEPLTIAPIAWRERRLANGLQAISVQSRASPTVSVQVWYHVGGRDDPAGRSGFAHLFEHLMFKGTEYLRPQQFDRLTEDVGGNNNAATSDDVTSYESVVPSNWLETLLWAEAERMSNLKVAEADFRSERAVVEEEYRERVLASPYGRFFDALTTQPYQQHAYRRAPIGSIADLEAATLEDVRAFHARHYRPDNATLVVAGDFDPGQLDAWVDRYFGAVPRPAEPLVRAEPQEPAWASDRALHITGPNVPLPAVAVTWLAPPLGHADVPALQVAAALLASGESSRLNQSLVYRQRIATQAGFEADLRAGPGLLIAFAIGAGGKPMAGVESALLAEIRRLVAVPPSSAEMAKIKTQILTQAFTARQTALGLGAAIAQAAVLEGGAAQVNSALAALQRVSAADVQRVLRRYVLGAHKVTLDYAQQAAAAVAK
ncbi:MAG: pitrilysin family protein [Caldimonas sp.]